MSLPFAFPDWVPWWVPLLVLLPALLYALAFLFMPFSVIGLKSRMEALEARLDDIQGELRQVATRLPAPARQVDFEDTYLARPPVKRAAEPAVKAPLVPPTPQELRDLGDYPDEHPPSPSFARPQGGRGETPRRSRSEPRLDWPR